MDAQDYKIPNFDGSTTTTDNGEITVLIDESNNDAGISLATGNNSTNHLTSITLSGRDRFFHIIYPDEGMKDGSTAVITVTKDGYNLIKYTLIFDEGTTLLTETELSQKGNEYRTEEYLSSHYELLTELNFDYDPEASDYSNDYYPFPMPWEASSYGFHDGGPNRAYNAGTATLLDKDILTIYNANAPAWGYYAFAKTGTSNDNRTNTDSDNTYFMFVDVSDRPGVIAQLPFREQLCNGAELFVTAWVQSHTNTGADVGIRFSIMGRYQNDDDTYTPWENIYSHNSGQITRKDEWQQTYFSFINGDSNMNYDEYCLQLDNVSSGTNGADLYLDDIQVYMARSTATATQKEAVCGDRTMMNISLNWEQLYSRLGGSAYQDDEDALGGIDFCIIDTLLYRAEIPYNEATNKTETEILNAIKKAAVYIGNGESYNEQYGTLYYYWNFDQNKEYQDNDDNLAADNNIAEEGQSARYAFYRRGSADENDQEITVDIQAELSPLRGYWLLIRDHKGISEDTQDESGWPQFRNPDEACAIRSEFSVSGWNTIKINGEVIGNEDVHTYCAGQVFDFGIQMMYNNSEGKPTEYTGEVYFDWFFGTQAEYEEEQTSYESVTIRDALVYFRQEYPDATEITDAVTPDGDFTQNHLNLLKSLLTTQGEGMLNARLVLHQSRRQIRIQEGGLNLVIKPIQTTVTIEDETEALFCWEPIYLTLNTEGDSPKLDVGFNDVTYPEEWTNNPVFRVGLEQIEKANVPAENKTNDVTINIPLRNAKPAEGTGNVTLGKMTDESEHELFLRYSDDPALSAIFADPDFDRHEYSIGKLVSLSATTRTEGAYDATDVMKLQFNLAEQETPMPDGTTKFKFTPREGYYYTFDVHFEEQDNDNDDNTEDNNGASCFGNLLVTMKVVPAYQKWVGEANANWNNDNNWVRSKKDELKKGDDYSDYEEDHQGYVPMKFTKVTIPTTNKQVELYPASPNTSAGTDTHRILNLATTEVSGEATPNIEYDLMVKPEATNNAYDCETYYTNTVDQIHFEPNAEMLHAELLDYNKAWVDYKLESGKWHTLASPLQGVVAGDFYTDSKTATEEQEYFTGITFDGKDENGTNSSANNAQEGNNRIKPSVYQRGWGKDAKMITVGGTTTPNTVAVQGNWSAVYNNVEEKYEPGTGFSLKVLDMPTNADGNAIFRLPKADNSYSYYNSDETAVSDTPIKRSENSGKLMSDELKETDGTTSKEISVTLT